MTRTRRTLSPSPVYRDLDSWLSNKRNAKKTRTLNALWKLVCKASSQKSRILPQITPTKLWKKPILYNFELVKFRIENIINILGQTLLGHPVVVMVSRWNCKIWSSRCLAEPFSHMKSSSWCSAHYTQWQWKIENWSPASSSSSSTSTMSQNA